MGFWLIVVFPIGGRGRYRASLSPRKFWVVEQLLRRTILIVVASAPGDQAELCAAQKFWRRQPRRAKEGFEELHAQPIGRSPVAGKGQAARNQTFRSSASVSPNRLSYGCPATIFLDLLASAIGL
jgi:hypothetical protein